MESETKTTEKTESPDRQTDTAPVHETFVDSIPVSAAGVPKKAKSPAASILPLAIVVSLVLGFSGGIAGSYLMDHSKNTISEQKVVMSNQSAVIADIAKNVGKSVVSINVTQRVTGTGYFGNPVSSQAQAAGTGIIISKDGLIMTNRHVVPAGTTNVSVTLSDGTKLDDVSVAGRTGSSDSLDIAFLKVNNLKGATLTPAKLGDSSKMKVGDQVVAIGNALGQFQNTVTTGIVSGYGRSLTAGSSSDSSSSENLENLFQTDAAINEGNSGGPLVNLSGEVIGVNVAIADDAQSVGFSIPINDVKGLVNTVETTGKVERPYLGVVYLPITADVASQYGLSVNSGAYVAPSGVTGQDPIMPGSPAEKAGLKPADIITKVDGEQINEGASLTSLLGKHKVGDKVSLTIIRAGKTITVDATLASAPTD